MIETNNIWLNRPVAKGGGGGGEGGTGPPTNILAPLEHFREALR